MQIKDYVNKLLALTKFLSILSINYFSYTQASQAPQALSNLEVCQTFQTEPELKTKKNKPVSNTTQLIEDYLRYLESYNYTELFNFFKGCSFLQDIDLEEINNSSLPKNMIININSCVQVLIRIEQLKDKNILIFKKPIIT